MRKVTIIQGDEFAHPFLDQPLVGKLPNWTFFMDQSPWIWLNYLAIVVLGHLSRFFYLKSPAGT